MTESILTIRSNGYAYYIDADKSLLKEIQHALDKAYEDGADDGECDHDPWPDDEPPAPDYEGIHALIQDYIFKITMGTTLAERSAVEVLEELARDIQGLE